MGAAEVGEEEVESPERAAGTRIDEDRPRVIAYDGPTARDHWMRWARAIGPLGLAVALSFVARFLPTQVEALYSRGAYPKVAGVIDRAGRAWQKRMELDGFAQNSPSLSEVALGAALLVGLLFLLHALSKGVGTFVRRTLWVTGSGALLFIMAWGLNYARSPLEDTLGVDGSKVSAHELDRVAAEMAALLSAALDEPHEKIDRVTVPHRTAAVWAEALDREPHLGWQRAPVVVGPFSSGGLVSAGISGIFSPFTQEAHVATHLPEPDLLFTACHEVAHVQGWAREDEANYLAWRVGARSSDPAFRRAVLIVALYQVHGALREADPELLAQRWEELDPRIETEFKARARFWARERSYVTSRAVSAVNDVYLKSQGQEGVASYGRMVDLLVAEWRSEGLAVVAR